jgi:hypothetical protein
MVDDHRGPLRCTVLDDYDGAAKTYANWTAGHPIGVLAD